MNNTILTYYQELGAQKQRKVLDLWVKVWTAHGWEPKILGYDDAKAHPRFEELTKHAESLPTVNCRAFEMACYQRWCAFAMHGGTVVDYDVMPRGLFPPQEFKGLTCGELGGGPSLVSGTPAEYERIIDAIIRYEPSATDITFGKPHVSDMIILRAHKELFDSILDLCRTYMCFGWENTPLVHFASAYMRRKDEMDRADEISLILNL